MTLPLEQDTQDRREQGVGDRQATVAGRNVIAEGTEDVVTTGVKLR